MTEADHSEGAFRTHLTSELLSSSFRYESHNIDRDRYKDEPFSLKSAVKDKILRLAASRGFYRAPDVDYGVMNIDGLERAYLLLEDRLSKDLFVKLLAYRILGPRRVRLPLNNAQYWSQRRLADRYAEQRGVRSSGLSGAPMLRTLNLYNVDGIRYYGGDPLNTFVLEQYRCERAGIGVKTGDVAIDGGACWGDTALYFAREAEQVFSFECMPANLALFRENLALNPTLVSKIHVVEKALWSRSGEHPTLTENGPGSRQACHAGGVEVTTQSIDDFVRESAADRVDFIKMDIEGAEPEALIGAEGTLRAYRPQLAICLYHDVKHFASIPNWLASLDLGYRFYLGHFTIHGEETVLFARSGA